MVVVAWACHDRCARSGIVNHIRHKLGGAALSVLGSMCGRTWPNLDFPLDSNFVVGVLHVRVVGCVCVNVVLYACWATFRRVLRACNNRSQNPGEASNERGEVGGSEQSFYMHVKKLGTPDFLLKRNLFLWTLISGERGPRAEPPVTRAALGGSTALGFFLCVWVRANERGPPAPIADPAGRTGLTGRRKKKNCTILIAKQT